MAEGHSPQDDRDMGRGSHDGSSSSDASALPDFAAGGSHRYEGSASAVGAHGPATLGEPTERARRRARGTIIAVISGCVVLLGVLALVLSQTVFRSVLEDPPTTAGGGSASPRNAEGGGEYVPDPNDPELAPPPPLFTQAPTTDCYVPSSGRTGTGSSQNTMRGGGLEFTYPDTWDYPWYGGGVPYLTDIGAQARNVEGSWYSVVNVGAVEFPESEGGYPGMERAAVAIFQCYATTAGVISHFGEHPTVTDYRTESTTVDGHPAWIVQATYHFEDPDMLSSTSASVVTSIVVEGPDGPSALASDVAADHEDHVAELEEMISSLKVVS